MEQAERSSWKTEPMPDARALLSFERTLSSSEYQRLSQGFIPREMEDKWFVFLERDWLYFHRSWTGYCIYQVRLRDEEGRYVIAEAWASRDAEQYLNTDDGVDVRSLHRLIDWLLR